MDAFRKATEEYMRSLKEYLENAENENEELKDWIKAELDNKQAIQRRNGEYKNLQ